MMNTSGEEGDECDQVLPLDKNQLECVHFPINNTALLCVAAAGSGKTEVLTHRVVHLVNDCNISGRNILCLTFSKKAALEMRNRLRLRCKSSHNEDSFEMVHISTIHSFCHYAWKQNLDNLPIHVQDVALVDKEKRQMITDILEKDFELNPHVLRERVKEVENYIQHVPYNRMLHVMNYDQLGTFQITDDNERVYREIRRQMKEKNHIDFNDLIHICIYLLENDELFSSTCKSLYRHILVDEFQDMGYLEYELLKRLVDLSGPIERSISCFGDDDQCIYTFKGSSPKIFDWFKLSFPTYKVQTIDTNYRSSNAIVTAANSLIQVNTNRMHKNIQAAGSIDQNAVQVQPTFDRTNEGLYIVDQIQKLVENGRGRISYKDISILCRVKKYLGSTKQTLKEYMIPYKEITNGDKRVGKPKDSREVVDILAYLTVLATAGNTTRKLQAISDEAFRRIIPKTRQRNTMQYLEELQKDQGGVALWDALKFAKESGFPQTDSENESSANNEKAMGTQLTIFNYANNKVSVNANWKHRPTTKMITKAGIEYLSDFCSSIERIIRKCDTFAEKSLPGDFVAKLIDFICKETAYKDVLASRKSTTEGLNELKRQAQSLLFGASQRDPWRTWIDKLLKSRKVETITFSSSKPDSNSVTVSTIHQAKGLEWKVVFLIGMNTGVLPINENSSHTIEDERRIAFVAMTRAKERLFVTYWDKDESSIVRARSRFVDEVLIKNNHVKVFPKQDNIDWIQSIESSKQFDLMNVDDELPPKPQATKLKPRVLEEEFMEEEANPIVYPEVRKFKKPEAPQKKKVVMIMNESKMTKGQKKDIAKSSAMMATWLKTKGKAPENEARLPSSLPFTVHEDLAPKTTATTSTTPKRPREKEAVKETENLEPKTKKARTTKPDKKQRRVLADKKDVPSDKSEKKPKQKKSAAPKITKSDSKTTSKANVAVEPASAEKKKTLVLKKKAEQPVKSDDELICEAYSANPVGIQFLIGQHCPHCNEFLTNEYIEEHQERITGFDVPCEHCREDVEVRMKVMYKHPVTHNPLEEDCNRFSKRAIRTIIANINKCSGETGSIETMWILENQRDLFWNILYHAGDIQKHIHSILHPAVKTTTPATLSRKSRETKKQQSILDLMKRDTKCE